MTKIVAPVSSIPCPTLSNPVLFTQIVEDGEEVTKIVVPANAEEGLFPLKMRDEAITAGGWAVVTKASLLSVHAVSASAGPAAPLERHMAAHAMCYVLPPAGVAFLREKGLLPADDSSDDDVNYAEAVSSLWLWELQCLAFAL